jgi:hypothetical protein
MSSLSESNPFQRMVDQIQNKYDPFILDKNPGNLDMSYDEKLDHIINDLLN